MKTIPKLIPLFLLTFLFVSCANSGVTTPPATTPSQPTTTAPPITPPVTTAPPVTPPTAVPSITVTFDFDTAVPPLLTGQSTPFEQMSGGVTAYFNPPSGPATFSVQSYDTTFFTLPQFSGKYLMQNKLSMTKLNILFSHQLTRITLTFATTDYHGVGEVEEPTAIKLTAYVDSAGVSPVGSATARGTFPANYTFPQGTLSFNSGGKAFNLVVIEIVFQPGGGSNFLVDNIIVTTAP